MLTAIKKSVKAGHRVDTNHVDAAIRNYKQERWAQNSTRIGKPDSLSVWYSVEELEEFLSQVKTYGGDGIKMYFGVYDEEHAPQPLYEGRQTVVLVATRENQTGEGLSNKDIYINTEEGTSILAYNAGRICPPFCNSSDDFEIGVTIIDKGEEGLIVS